MVLRGLHYDPKNFTVKKMFLHLVLLLNKYFYARPMAKDLDNTWAIDLLIVLYITNLLYKRHIQTSRFGHFGML